MHMENFTVQDEGFYSCVVENKHGSISFTMDTIIIGKYMYMVHGKHR